MVPVFEFVKFAGLKNGQTNKLKSLKKGLYEKHHIINYSVFITFWYCRSAGPFWAHPVIHNGILYMRHSNALMAYDIKAK